jgi:ribosomal protein S14
MKHLVVKDRNLRKQIKKLDKKLFLSKILNKVVDSKVDKCSNRCIITGRSKAVLRFFKHSRIKVRENILNGRYAGICKSS